MTDETKRWQAEIDREIAEAADARLDHGERKELIEDLAETIANHGLEDRTPYDVRLRQLRSKRQEKVAEREKLEGEIESLDDEIDVLRDKRDQYESTTDKLKGRIEGVEADLRRGTNIFVDNPMVQDIAREYDITAEEIVERLRERNTDIPPWAFSDPMEDQWIDDWNGLDEDAASTPPNERSIHPERR